MGAFFLALILVLSLAGGDVLDGQYYELLIETFMFNFFFLNISIYVTSCNVFKNFLHVRLPLVITEISLCNPLLLNLLRMFAATNCVIRDRAV